MFFNMFNINDFNLCSADFLRIWRRERVFGHVVRHSLPLIQYNLPNIRTTGLDPHDITYYFSVHDCLLSSENSAISVITVSM